MTIFDSFLLGIVQGLTEFLPISSSGHLILLRDVLGINTSGGLAFDAILQLGTVLAVFAYFRQTIVNLVFRDAVRIVRGRSREVKKEDRTLLLSLIVGTIPALALGILLEQTMETTFRSATLVAWMLIAGSLLFIIAERCARPKLEAPSVKQAWWIGWFQSLALIPGVSRSGATISGGLLFGLTREAAARYSFLLSLPIITASGLKKLYEVWQVGLVDASWLQLGVGFAASFVVGLACINFLLRYLKNHTLYAFVWYRVAVAAIVLLLSLS